MPTPRTCPGCGAARALDETTDVCHACIGPRAPFPAPGRVPGTWPAASACAARRYDDEEDDDDFDDVPRRRRRPPTSSGGNGTGIVLIVIGSVCLVILLVCGGFIALIGVGIFEAAKNAPNPGGQLNVQNAAVPATPVVLRPDGSFQDNNRLAFGDPQEFGKTYKLYRIRFEQGRTYVIDLMSNEIDAYLYLADTNNLIVAEDDDGGNGLNSRIVFTAPVTGDYKVRATSLHGQLGNFMLTIRRQ